MVFFSLKIIDGFQPTLQEKSTSQILIFKK